MKTEIKEEITEEDPLAETVQITPCTTSDQDPLTTLDNVSYPCDQCNYIGTDPSALSHHTQLEHNKEKVQVYPNRPELNMKQVFRKCL